MELPKVEGVLDMERFSIKTKLDLFGKSDCICYDDVPLWRTGVDLEGVEIFLYDASKDSEDESFYALCCKDSYNDVYTYGSWKTLEDAKEWLEQPIALY